MAGFDRLLPRTLATAPLHEQVASLEGALQRSSVVQAILAVAVEGALPNWYLGAGCIAQTVWNQLHGFEPAQGINDFDLVYFDSTDLSVGTESAVQQDIAQRLPGLETMLDVKNEARVHLWYQERFGRPVEAYTSTEEAISTWPTTASSVGVRYHDGCFVVCAPFGLADLFGVVARPNKAIVSKDVYDEKTARWAARWPRLTVIPW